MTDDSPVPDRRPILVTGSHRSGTTWTGRMLALAPRVGYIHEPFNVEHRHGVCRAPIRLRYLYIHAGNEARYAPGIARTLAFRYDLPGALLRVRSRSGLNQALKDARDFAAYRRAGARPLVKDPMALLSAEWLADRFGMAVVVLIRHPAAFAASVKALGWRHGFGEFLAQPELMAGPLAPFAGEIRRHAEAPRPLMEELALLWNLIHHVIDGYRERHPEWTFVRHEDLARDPEPGFAALYDRLGLAFGEATRAALAAHTGRQNRGAPAHPFDVRRDSAATVAAWRERLSAEEVDVLRARTAPLADRFYGPQDW